MNQLGRSLRRTRVRERPARRTAVAAASSILLNALGILLLARAGAFQIEPAREASRVALAPISADRWAANRAVAGEAKAPRQPSAPFVTPPPQPKVPEPPPVVRGQVVEVAPQFPTAPQHSRFLSDRDNSVAKETRARLRTADRAVLAVPSSPRIETGLPPGQGGRAERPTRGIEGERSAPAPTQSTPKVAMAPKTEADLGTETRPQDGSALAPAPTPPPTVAGGEGGERSAGDPLAHPLLSPGTLARIAGGPSMDRLDDVDEGEGTFLNTRAWKYATYFNRVKRAVASAWDPMTPYTARDPMGSVYGRSDRETLVDVTLDDRGNLKKVEVAQSCGLDFLDLAAVKAFEAAAPFPNPPSGVVDPNGEVRFPFSFTLEMGGRSGLRVHFGPMMPYPTGLP